MNDSTFAELEARIRCADKRYGPFASTHEALGVASEEWDEFRDAVHWNILSRVKHEALDLAASLVRLSQQIDDSALRERSVK